MGDRRAPRLRNGREADGHSRRARGLGAFFRHPASLIDNERSSGHSGEVGLAAEGHPLALPPDRSEECSRPGSAESTDGQSDEDRRAGNQAQEECFQLAHRLRRCSMGE